MADVFEAQRVAPTACFAESALQVRGRGSLSSHVTGEQDRCLAARLSNKPWPHSKWQSQGSSPDRLAGPRAHDLLALHC